MKDIQVPGDPVDDFWLVHPSEDQQIDAAIGEARDAGLAVYVLDGRRMQSKYCMLEELASTLGFPEHFGLNFDALDEVLNDPSWLPECRGCVLLISHGEEVLFNDDYSLGLLIQIFTSAQEEWAQRTDIPLTSLHLVFWATDRSDELSRRWKRHGASLRQLILE